MITSESWNPTTHLASIQRAGTRSQSIRHRLRDHGIQKLVALVLPTIQQRVAVLQLCRSLFRPLEHHLQPVAARPNVQWNIDGTFSCLYVVFVWFYVRRFFPYLPQCCHPASTSSLLMPWGFRSFKYRPILRSSSRLLILSREKHSRLMGKKSFFGGRLTKDCRGIWSL